MPIIASHEYIFTKSGSRVRALERLDNGMWSVERSDTGKAMMVPAGALVPLDSFAD